MQENVVLNGVIRLIFNFNRLFYATEISRNILTDTILTMPILI